MSTTDASAVPASAQHTWRVSKPPSTRGRQGKLDPKRRLKAKVVRELRACLRCAALRIPCSQDDICIPCRKLVEIARHPYEKRTLSWCGCVRTWLLEVNPFEAAIPPPHMLDSVLKVTDSLGLRSINLSFESQITWDLPTIVLELIEWLHDPACFTTSKVGLLSSPRFIDLMEPYIGAEVGVNFQRMLYAESLAYTQRTTFKKHDLTIEELQQIGAVGGYAILAFLDKNLKAEALRSCSKEKARLEALFLLVIGTILAVGYTSPYRSCDGTMGGISSSGIVPHAQFTAMQDHLCQILAHYVLLLASRLNLAIPSTTERFILQAASKRWHKHGMFFWGIWDQGGSPVPYDTGSSDLFTLADPQGSERLRRAGNPRTEACNSHGKDIAIIDRHVHTKNSLLPTSRFGIEIFQTSSRHTSNTTRQDNFFSQKNNTAFWLLNSCQSAELDSHDFNEDSPAKRSRTGRCVTFDNGDPAENLLLHFCSRRTLSPVDLPSMYRWDGLFEEGYGNLLVKDYANATDSLEISQSLLPRLPDVIQNPHIWQRYLELSLEGCQNPSYKEGVLEQIKAEQNLLV